MSLYGKSNTNQTASIGNLVPASGLPAWAMGLAGYFVVTTLINKVPETIDIFKTGEAATTYLSYLLGNGTAIFSACALTLYLFGRYGFSLYYLLIASLADSAAHIVTVVAKTEGLSPYIYSLQGLDSVPLLIFGWFGGWSNFSDTVRHFVNVADPIASLAFCGLLLHFHSKRQSVAQSI